MGAEARSNCVAVRYATTPDAVALVHKCSSVQAAKGLVDGLVDEEQCAIRKASQHDGILFPPPLVETEGTLAKAIACKAIPASDDAPVPKHVVVVDIDEPKKRDWHPRVFGFGSGTAAATWALHCFRTAGARVKSIEMHAFDGSGSEAAPRMHLQSGGVFDAKYAIADIAALEAVAEAA